MSNQLDFLKYCHGVIHVGANKGQSRYVYNEFNLDVLWVEAIPDVFNLLKNKTSFFPKQKAINACVTDKDDDIVDFHIINRYGLSSSIFKLKGHKEMFPQVSENSVIQLKTKTLNTIINENNLLINMYDALILDVQGAELKVLNGGPNNFKFIMLEVADFEAYDGCCMEYDIQKWMSDNNYVEYRRYLQKHKDGLGSYWDIVYKKDI